MVEIALAGGGVTSTFIIYYRLVIVQLRRWKLVGHSSF